MKPYKCLLLLIFLLCSQASLAQQVSTKEPKIVPILVLINHSELKKDLKLSNEEYKKFRDAFKNIESFYDNFEKKLAQEIQSVMIKNQSKDISIEQIKPILEEKIDFLANETKKVRTEIRQLLSKEQYNKFSTRVVQIYAGMPYGYVMVDFFDVLKLTDEQKRKIYTEYNKFMLDTVQQGLQGHIQAGELSEDYLIKASESFDQILTKEQNERRDNLVLNESPSYLRILLFPEELTEYDSLHESTGSVPQAFRLALQKEFLNGIGSEAKLTPEETKRLLETIQKAGKRCQYVHNDYTVNLQEGMDEKEAVQTLVRSTVQLYQKFNKELHSFLDKEKTTLIQKRLTQLSEAEIVLFCVFIWEDFKATNEDRKRAMTYHYKTILAYRTFVKNYETKSSREQLEFKKKYDEHCRKNLNDFIKGLKPFQQKLMLKDSTENHPDYFSKILLHKR